MSEVRPRAAVVSVLACTPRVSGMEMRARTGEVEDTLGRRSESWRKQMRRPKLKRLWS